MRVAFGLALLVVLVGAVAVVSSGRPHLAGTNNVFDSFPNLTVPAGGEACARDEIVPGDAAAVRVKVKPEGAPGGPVELRLEQGGRELARGSLAAGWLEGPVDIPIRPVVADTQAPVSVCFVNQGEPPMTLWGYGAPADGPRMVLDGVVTNERTRLTYLRPGEESGWDVAGAVVRRMGNGRGDLLGGWAFYGWLAALAGALAAAAAALLLRGRRT